jgi:thiol-disulfide isomerase/thioredoxin
MTHNQIPRIAFAATALGLAFSAGSVNAQELTGRWQATAEVAGNPIPFALALKTKQGAASGHFFDGARSATPSSSGTFKSGHLHLDFPSYAASLDADLTGGALDGAYTVGGKVTKIHAVKAAATRTSAHAPNIAGEWIIPNKSPKGEVAWRLIVKQRGGAAEASILRIDGDTGTLSGVYRDGVFTLSHFAGERPAKLEIQAQPDHSLKLVLSDGGGARSLNAVRAEQATALGATPDDPRTHTSLRDPSVPLQFSFVDLDGKPVSNTDPRFKGKVVVVDIMGSWCPNCHDEAPYLQALYKKYHGRGLEVVALDFEQPDQLANPQRLRAFIQRYGLTYTVLLAGEPKEVNAKLPQAVNLNAWPTTFFVGRDGLVKGAHVGFTSPGSGQRDVETRAEVESTVARLLAEPSPTGGGE